MSALALSESYLTEEEYLAREEASQIKHEYLGGDVYAMSGAGTSHNRLSTNLISSLATQLRGKRCEASGSDMKVRLRMRSPDTTYFYYPDAMIVCARRGLDERGWCEQPSAIFEITSERTRHIDEREKRLAYLQIGSLEAYVRIEQKRLEVVLDLRTVEGWQRQRISGGEGVVRLPTLQIELPLAELYERVEFGAGDDQDDES